MAHNDYGWRNRYIFIQQHWIHIAHAYVPGRFHIPHVWLEYDGEVFSAVKVLRVLRDVLERLPVVELSLAQLWSRRIVDGTVAEVT